MQPGVVDGPGTLSAATSALDAAGVAWLLPRDAGDPAAGDVDLLVERPAVAAGALSSAGFLPVRARGHGSHRFFVGFDEATGCWLSLDLVSRLDFGTWQEHRTALAQPLLARRVCEDGDCRPAADDAFWILLLHLALRRKAASAARLAELAALAAPARVAGPAADLVARRLGVPVAEQLRDRAAGGQPAQAVAQLSAAWPARGVGVAAARTARRVLRHIPVRATEGLTLAVIGPDGAGKTTLLESLLQTLPVPTRYVYMGVWRTGEAERWARHVPGARLLLRLLRLLGGGCRTWTARAQGEVVLLDRFTLDAALPSDDLDWRGRASAVLVQRTAAPPDRIVLLDGPPEVMFARKGEHGAAELARRRAAYLAMLPRFPQMVVVDATQPRDVVRNQVAAQVWEDLRRRAGGAR